jgi:hypothetical protein
MAADHLVLCGCVLIIMLDERERALSEYRGVLFVQQIEVPRGEFICATNV